MKLFHIEDPTGVNNTDWFYTVAEARRNAFELNYSLLSTVIEATILGHDDMRATIKNLLNQERRIIGRLKVIRSLGSDKEVAKNKVHLIKRQLEGV
mgnify:CR=1 FL=1|jgi:hypothetical protein|tara:strand:- start:2906 stop:3193 length:288 start_codon:yes stop_codon:yes gene_type:complete